MKIMFVCAAHHLRVELIHLTPFLAQLPYEFIVSPLVRLEEKERYQAIISGLGRSYKNIVVDPIFLRSSSQRFASLLNPNVLLQDSFSLLNVIRRRKPDNVVCYYLIHAYPFVLLKKIFGFSMAVLAQGSDVNLDRSLFERQVAKLVCRSSDLIFAASWTLKDIIETEYNRSVSVIPSSTDSSFFRPLRSKSMLRYKWDIAREKQVILCATRIDRFKGIDLVIKSLLAVPENVVLLIAGEGESRETFEQLTVSLGLQHRVTFLGFRNRQEVVELYNLADVFVNASYSEGLPRALIESMACECIPIVTNVGSMPKVVSNGFNGFLVNPGDSEGLVESIKKVFSLSKEQKRLMQTRARHTVKDDFDSRKTLKRMIDKIVDLRMSRV